MVYQIEGIIYHAGSKSLLINKVNYHWLRFGANPFTNIKDIELFDKIKN